MRIAIAIVLLAFDVEANIFSRLRKSQHQTGIHHAAFPRQRRSHNEQARQHPGFHICPQRPGRRMCFSVTRAEALKAASTEQPPYIEAPCTEDDLRHASVDLSGMEEGDIVAIQRQDGAWIYAKLTSHSKDGSTLACLSESDAALLQYDFGVEEANVLSDDQYATSPHATEAIESDKAIRLQDDQDAALPRPVIDKAGNHEQVYHFDEHAASQDVVVGNRCEVTKTLYYKKAVAHGTSYTLSKGIIGKVEAIDNHGDAYLDFGKPLGYQWVLKADHCHLKRVEAETVEAAKEEIGKSEEEERSAIRAAAKKAEEERLRAETETDAETAVSEEAMARQASLYAPMLARIMYTLSATAAAEKSGNEAHELAKRANVKNDDEERRAKIEAEQVASHEDEEEAQEEKAVQKLVKATSEAEIEKVMQPIAKEAVDRQQTTTSADQPYAPSYPEQPTTPPSVVQTSANLAVLTGEPLKLKAEEKLKVFQEEAEAASRSEASSFQGMMRKHMLKPSRSFSRQPVQNSGVRPDVSIQASSADPTPAVFGSQLDRLIPTSANVQTAVISTPPGVSIQTDAAKAKALKAFLVDVESLEVFKSAVNVLELAEAVGDSPFKSLLRQVAAGDENMPIQENKLCVRAWLSKLAKLLPEGEHKQICNSLLRSKDEAILGLQHQDEQRATALPRQGSQLDELFSSGASAYQRNPVQSGLAQTPLLTGIPKVLIAFIVGIGVSLGLVRLHRGTLMMGQTPLLNAGSCC